MQLIEQWLNQVVFDRPDEMPEGEDFEVAIQFESEATPMPDGEPAETSGANGQTPDEVDRMLVSLVVWIEWEPSPGPFKFQLHYDGVFQREPEMSQDEFNEMCETAGPDILFTHARSLAHNVLSEAGENFRIPPIDVAEVFRQQR